MNLTNDGLTLWYGTPDAPAPGDDGVVPRDGASLVVGVSPANPTNTVMVRHRVDGGLVYAVTGRELRTDYARQAQYFAVKFPAFPTGEVVEYSPVLSCAGRQVPPPHIASRFPSTFRLAAKVPAADVARPAPAARGSTATGQRYAPDTGFVASVAVQFDSPQFIGDTAAGMRVDFIVREGSVVGDGIRGKVTEGSSDHLIVRRDGMGVVRIRAAFAMDDGGVLDVESGGYVDFGADGYRRALAHNLPDCSPLVVSPLISTRHPKYRWLSRVQCVGVGQTHLDAGQASYQVYAVAPRKLT
jgi:Protein of unknown function (DUF3237)